MIQVLATIALLITTVIADDATPVKRGYLQHSLEELSDMSIWERVKLNDWRLEFYTIGFTVVFAILFKVGDLYNKKLVTGFLNGIKGTLEENFYQVGVFKDALYVKDSPENYSSYATGRENINKINLDFKLRPRNNIFVWFLEGVMSYFTEFVQKPIDKVDIVIQPSFVYDNFITAVVSKLGMNDYRKFNYFLSLTKTTDSTKLPESFVFMSEASEFQDKVFDGEIAQSLDIEAASYIRYIAFTDQATEKPETTEEFSPYRRIVISLRLPSKKENIAQVSNTLRAIFSVIDQLADKSISFKSESLKKIAKAREGELGKLQKALEVQRLEAEAEEKARLKKEEREKLRNLSPEEQAKIEKKEMERKQKKLQKKQRVRM